MSGGEYKDLIVFKPAQKAGGKVRAVKVGRIFTGNNGRAYITIDALPIGQWWDGSIAVSEPRAGGAGGWSGGGGGGGSEEPPF